jgi:SagB-type dehydrogenase family enzyme
MKRILCSVVLVALLVPLIFAGGCGKAENGAPAPEGISIPLPGPAYDSDTSVEQALLQRRSVRDFAEGSLTLAQVGQLLWAAQGITDPSGKRTAPSAGELYPLEVYVLVGNVAGLDPGVYHYRPDGHSLVRMVDGERRESLAAATNGQGKVARGAITIVITAAYDRVTGKYGRRGERYAQLEAGHAAQNLYLQAVSLDLGMVVVGDFNDSAVRQVLTAPKDETPLYIIPVGMIAGQGG